MGLGLSPCLCALGCIAGDMPSPCTGDRTPLLKLARNANEIKACYEAHLKRLTDKFYKNAPWPSADQIAPIVNDDKIFLTLYKELYFRHLYASSHPTVNDRIESFENYCDFFNLIIDDKNPISLELPNSWLWDIIDEFIYQFQTFAQYRSRVDKLSEDDLAILKSNPRVWNVHIVLNALQTLIDKSNINQQLEVYHSGSGNPQEVAGEYGCKTLYKMLGYFSLVGMLRLHSLLGDYYQALKVVENIELNKKGLYSRVPQCQITVYYYVGFAYLMTRRYQDAVRSFASILCYIHRTQNFHTRSSGYDMLVKKREQLFALLAIVMTLAPQRIDESVQAELVQKFGELMQSLHRGESAAAADLFQKGCPKFVSPVAPRYEAEPRVDVSHEPYKVQLKLFQKEVTQQVMIPVIRSYLKLYSTMPIEKLASFLKMDTNTFRVHLHSYKHKCNQLVWSSGVATSGSRASSDDVDFFIEKDMIHIANVKVARCYGDYFVGQINKMIEAPK